MEKNQKTFRKKYKTPASTSKEERNTSNSRRSCANVAAQWITYNHPRLFPDRQRKKYQHEDFTEKTESSVSTNSHNIPRIDIKHLNSPREMCINDATIIMGNQGESSEISSRINDTPKNSRTNTDEKNELRGSKTKDVSPVVEGEKNVKIKFKTLEDLLRQIPVEKPPLAARTSIISPETLEAIRNAERLVLNAEKQLMEMDFNTLLLDDFGQNKENQYSTEDPEARYRRQLVALKFAKGDDFAYPDTPRSSVRFAYGSKPIKRIRKGYSRYTKTATTNTDDKYTSGGSTINKVDNKMVKRKTFRIQSGPTINIPGTMTVQSTELANIAPETASKPTFQNIVVCSETGTKPRISTANNNREDQHNKDDVINISDKNDTSNERSRGDKKHREKNKKVARKEINREPTRKDPFKSTVLYHETDKDAISAEEFNLSDIALKEPCVSGINTILQKQNKEICLMAASSYKFVDFLGACSVDWSTSTGESEIVSKNYPGRRMYDGQCQAGQKNSEKLICRRKNMDEKSVVYPNDHYAKSTIEKPSFSKKSALPRATKKLAKRNELSQRTNLNPIDLLRKDASSPDKVKQTIECAAKSGSDYVQSREVPKSMPEMRQNMYIDLSEKSDENLIHEASINKDKITLKSNDDRLIQHFTDSLAKELELLSLEVESFRNIEDEHPESEIKSSTKLSTRGNKKNDVSQDDFVISPRAQTNDNSKQSERESQYSYSNEFTGEEEIESEQSDIGAKSVPLGSKMSNLPESKSSNVSTNVSNAAKNNLSILTENDLHDTLLDSKSNEESLKSVPEIKSESSNSLAVRSRSESKSESNNELRSSKLRAKASSEAFKNTNLNLKPDSESNRQDRDRILNSAKGRISLFLDDSDKRKKTCIDVTWSNDNSASKSRENDEEIDKSVKSNPQIGLDEIIPTPDAPNQPEELQTISPSRPDSVKCDVSKSSDKKEELVNEANNESATLSIELKATEVQDVLVQSKPPIDSTISELKKKLPDGGSITRSNTDAIDKNAKTFAAFSSSLKKLEPKKPEIISNDFSQIPDESPTKQQSSDGLKSLSASVESLKSSSVPKNSEKSLQASLEPPHANFQKRNNIENPIVLSRNMPFVGTDKIPSEESPTRIDSTDLSTLRNWTGARKNLTVSAVKDSALKDIKDGNKRIAESVNQAQRYIATRSHTNIRTTFDDEISAIIARTRSRSEERHHGKTTFGDPRMFISTLTDNNTSVQTSSHLLKGNILERLEQCAIPPHPEKLLNSTIFSEPICSSTKLKNTADTVSSASQSEGEIRLASAASYSIFSLGETKPSRSNQKQSSEVQRDNGTSTSVDTSVDVNSIAESVGEVFGEQIGDDIVEN